MAKYARLSGSNRLTVRQVHIIIDCLNDSANQFTFVTFNQRGVLDNAMTKLSWSVFGRETKKYAHLGSGNRMTRIQAQRLIWFVDRIIPTYKRSNPQIHRVLGNALRKLQIA